MAFLDNSGDIVLDAVLTETGRKKLANGSFSIVKFALGDDEIGYNLYDKNNPSGSAYYDLEILQTPILEGLTTTAAGINYGLLSYANPRLLYLPLLKENALHPEWGALPYNKIYYLAVDETTTAALKIAFGGSTTGYAYVLKSGVQDHAIMLETGLDTTEIAGTSTNKSNYVVSQGLIDTSFAVSVDRRFIKGVQGPTPGTVFNNNGGMGAANITLHLKRYTPSKASSALTNHNLAIVAAIPNNVFFRLSDTTPDTSTSVIAGPRASFVAVNFDAAILTSTDYARYGQTALSIGGSTYSSIDTSVIISGMNTGTMLELPIRIIKKN